VTRGSTPSLSSTRSTQIAEFADAGMAHVLTHALIVPRSLQAAIRFLTPQPHIAGCQFEGDWFGQSSHFLPGAASRSPRSSWQRRFRRPAGVGISAHL
jgi:hypothetical protein